MKVTPINPHSSGNSQSDEVKIDPVRLMRYLYAHIHIILIFATAVPSVAGLHAFFVKKPIWESKTVISMDFSSQTESLLPQKYSFWYEEQELLNKIQMTVLFFNSVAFRRAVLDEIRGLTDYSSELPLSEYYKRIIRTHFSEVAKNSKSLSSAIFNSIELRSVPERYSMIIKVKTLDPTVSAALADLTAKTLVNVNYKTKKERTTRLIGFLEDQTSQTKNKLEELESKLVALQKKNKILSIDTVLSRSSDVQLKYEDRIRDYQHQIQSAELAETLLESEVKQLRLDIASGTQASGAYISQLEQRLELLKYQMESRQDRNIASETSISDIGIELQETLASLNSTLKNKRIGLTTASLWDYLKELETNIRNLRKTKAEIQGRLEAQKKTLEAYESEYLKLPQTVRSMLELQRSIDITSDLFKELQTKLQEALIKQAGTANDLKVISPAEVSDSPAGISVMRKFIISFILGLGLGSFIIFLKYVILPTIKDPEDLKNEGLPVIGSLPWLKDAPRPSLLSSETYPFRLLSDRPGSIEAMAIRQIRFRMTKSLLQDKNAQSGRVLEICSVHSGEGKTFCAVNLAEAFSINEVKVLILDLDVYTPDVKNYFPELSEKSPLACGEQKVQDYFKRFAVNPHVDICVPEPHTDEQCDFLDSGMFKRFVNEARQHYDLIILDTPPMHGHLEPYVVAQIADLIMFVVNQRITTREDIQNALQNIRESTEAPCISVMNFAYDQFRPVKRKLRTTVEETA